MRRMCMVLFGFLLVVLLAAPAGSPGCSCSSPSREPQAVPAVLLPSDTAKLDNTVRRKSFASFPVGSPPPQVEPMVYRDQATGIVFYFERDGQHVSAIDPNGDLLWTVNPTQGDFTMKFQRDGQQFGHPIIDVVGPAPDRQFWHLPKGKGNDDYISIVFWKAFGLLDKTTGEFVFLGSD
jgi:hypothetical protein